MRLRSTYILSQYFRLIRKYPWSLFENIWRFCFGRLVEFGLGTSQLFSVLISIFLIWQVVSAVLPLQLVRMSIISLTVFKSSCSWGFVTSCSLHAETLFLCRFFRWSSYRNGIYAIHVFCENIARMRVDACTLGWRVGGYVDDEGIVDNSEPTAIRFESAPHSCLIEIDLVSDDVIKFIGWSRLCHMASRFRVFSSNWLFIDPCWHPLQFYLRRCLER